MVVSSKMSEFLGEVNYVYLEYAVINYRSLPRRERLFVRTQILAKLFQSHSLCWQSVAFHRRRKFRYSLAASLHHYC